MIEMMDQGIGEVLRALDRLGLAKNTVVIFTSDHGDMFGDHGLMLKATMHYQGCLRLPLLIARPGEAGLRTQSLASSMDLAQTFLHLAGAKPFVYMQGKSLVPVLNDPHRSVRDHCLVEEEFPLALIGSPLPLHTRTIYTDRYRYSQYSSGDVELYDLVNDPDEGRNLAIESDYRNQRLEVSERLSAAMMSTAQMGVSA